MYSRQYSLKTRYNFSRVLKSPHEFTSRHLIIKYVKDDRNENPHFAVITSNRLTKKAVEQNQIRRVISEVINNNIERFPVKYNFVFIPKKTFFDKNGKIINCVEEINSEIDSFLSELDLA